MSNLEHDLYLRLAARGLSKALPAERLRIDRGLVLALNGAAEYYDDHWQVRSASDAEVVYALKPEGCECPDRQRAPEGRCKHYWAVYLTHAAQLKESTDVED
jgi:hypothetical protein